MRLHMTRKYSRFEQQNVISEKGLHADAHLRNESSETLCCGLSDFLSCIQREKSRIHTPHHGGVRPQCCPHVILP